MKLLGYFFFLAFGPVSLGSSTINSRDPGANICGSPLAVKGTSDFSHYSGVCGDLPGQDERTVHVPRYVGPSNEQHVLAPSDDGRDSWPSQASAGPRKDLINCKRLLQKPYIDCGSMKKRACGLLTWLYAGCQKAAQCQGKSGLAAKQCCDYRRTLPFGGGAYYEGYMRACAPQYKWSQFDRPVFNRLSCPALGDFECEQWMDRAWCDMRDWENARGSALGLPSKRGMPKLGSRSCQMLHGTRYITGSKHGPYKSSVPRAERREVANGRVASKGRFDAFFLYRYNQSCMTPIA
ncbi:uncharacterized protein G6M90_00g061510 [Metarhizium brunneum]|uniref:Extracellular membrane protein CFEM domain-containing protein n=1 Tax=Metarhizium brunneum TaxID=500148 RepID=A0A7D5Z5W2_9HYPO|nr:hypothetical protein G6M90_00g061510 [Metarhizium brunneum]